MNVIPFIPKGSVSEIIHPHITNLQVAYARQYKDNGKLFVKAFQKYASVRTACAFCCKQFETEVAPYEPDEKICNFVAGLKLDKGQTRLLARTLKMIKLITHATN